MPPGQPTKYRPEFCEQAIELLKVGASIEELSLEFDVDYSTIYQWMDDNPAFSQAVKKGREYSQAWWMRRGRTDLENDKFSATLWYMNMKNRFGWADKKEVTNTVTVTHEDQLKAIE